MDFDKVGAGSVGIQRVGCGRCGCWLEVVGLGSGWFAGLREVS